jgi:hypothetical protein
VNPVTIYEKPPFPPHVCVCCGVGQAPRKWFVDLGITLDYYFNPVNDGAIYLCDECWENLRVQVERQITSYNFNNAEWDSPERLPATYSWKDKEQVAPVGNNLSPEQENDDVSRPESGNSTESSGPELDVGDGFDTGSEGDSSSSEPDDPESESDDPDEQSKAAFTAIFGEQP